MPKLQRASGDKHVAAFKRAGWRVNHIEGSHHILIKEGSDVHLSIPVHKDRTLGIGLLKKLIAKAGLANEEYVNLNFLREEEKMNHWFLFTFHKTYPSFLFNVNFSFLI